jgi:integrase
MFWPIIRTGAEPNVIRLLLLTIARRGEAMNAHCDKSTLKTGSEGSQQRPQNSIGFIGCHCRSRGRASSHNPVKHACRLLLGISRPYQKQSAARDASCLERRARGVEARRYPLHDLRHTFVSRLVSGGVTPPMTSWLLGHTQAQTTLRYANL